MRFITVLSEHRDLSCYLAAYLKVCIAAHIVLNNVWLLRCVWTWGEVKVHKVVRFLPK